MSDLERMLTQLGRELDYPPTPDLTAAVASRLRGVEKPSPRRRPRLFPPAGLRRALVLALVGLLVLAGTVLAAVPGARDAVLEFFGLQGATVERTATLPTPPAQQSLDLGRRTTLERARERLAFEPLVPTLLGDPDFVYLGEAIQGGELSLAYRPGPGLPRARTTRLGLLVSEFRGDIHPDLVGKLAGPATRIESLTIDGRPCDLDRRRAALLLLPRPERKCGRGRAPPRPERPAAPAGPRPRQVRGRLRPRTRGRDGALVAVTSTDPRRAAAPERGTRASRMPPRPQASRSRS